MHAHRQKALVAATLVAAWSHAAHGLQMPDTAALTPVVVTATRVAGGERTATTSATVLTGDDLRERGIVSVSEALKSVPGVTIAQSGSTGGTTSLFLRGGENDYVQVLVDGVPINEPGGYVDLASLTTENIDRIEVVRGPTSVVYGSEAVTGVVQIFTRAGTAAPRATVSVRAGENRTLDANADVIGKTGPAGWSLAAARYSTDGILDFNNAYRNDVVSALVRTTHVARGDARLSLRYSDGTFHFPTDGAGVPVDSNQFSYERRVAVGSELGWLLTDRLEARLLVASSDLDGGTDDDPDNAQDPFRTRVKRDSYRRSADTRLLVHITPALVASAGAQLEWEREATSFRSEDLRPLPTMNFASSNDGRRWNRAYYAQAVGTTRSLLSYTGGVRLEDDEHFGSHWTYRAGAGIRLGSRTHFRSAVGTGFKRPLISEITGGGFAAPNEGLQPERSTSWDAGVEQRLLHDAVVVGVTYFAQRFRDLIQFTSTPDGNFHYENLAVVRADGVELEGRVHPAATVRVDLAYTYLDTEVEDAGADVAGATYVQGGRLLRRPTHQGTAGVSWRPWPALALHGNALFVGSRDDRYFGGGTAAHVKMPRYGKVDLAAEYALPESVRHAELTLSARADNVFDNEYEAIAGFRSPGRLITVGARLAMGGR